MPSRRGTIAVLTDDYVDYRKVVVDAVSAVAGRAGFGVLCVTGRELVLDADPEADRDGAVCNGIYRLVERSDVAGLICLAGTLGQRIGSAAVADFLGRYRVPCVSFGLEVAGVPGVVVDDVEGMTSLVEHLVVDAARERIAFVRGTPGDVYSSERERVFREVLTRHGREIDEALFVTGDYDAFEARHAVAALLRARPDVDAIVAANDLMALGAVRAVTAAGSRVPDDVAVSGFDDVPEAARSVPALTTVRQPVAEMAERSAVALIELIGRAARGAPALAPAPSVRVRSELVVRGTTMPGVPHDSPGPEGTETSEAFDLERLASALDAVAGRDEGTRVARIAATLSTVRERVRAVEVERERARAETLTAIGSCTTIEEILDAIERWAVVFRPRRCFLVRHDEPGTEPHARGRLISVVRDGLPEPRPDAPLDTSELLPPAYASELGEGLLILEPVHAGSDHFGYLLIDPEGSELSRIDGAARSIGNALRNHYLIATLEDRATRLREANAELSALANRDVLTGLPNRLCMERRLRELCEQGGIGGRFALCFLDLDGFKLVNDTLGHAVGDLLLASVATRLTHVVDEIVGEGSFVARLGGDEFTVVLLSSALDDDLGRVVPALLEALAEPHRLAGHEVHVSASIGGASFPDHGEDAGTLLKRADTAMYGAKARGKNGFAMYRPDLMADVESRSGLAREMREALANGEFRMHYQPRIELASGRIRAVEALMRWMVDGPDGEVAKVGPDVFVPIAENTGFIDHLDDFALETACRQAAAWERAGTPLRVSVNVSAVQLQRAGFVRIVTDAVRRHELSPSLLELEITETAAMQDIDDSVRKLERLRARGVEVSIDDFGTGHSSLSYLGRVPAGTLKIDRSFVRAIDDVDGGRSNGVLVLSAIVTMCRSLGFALVAEGIETEAQRRLVESLGCEEGQGYLFARPGPAEDIVPPAPESARRLAG